MLIRIAASLALAPAVAGATEFSCADASAYYNYSMLTSKVLTNLSGACAEDLGQSACVAFLNTLTEEDEHLEKAKQGSPASFLLYLKEQCPDDFPDNPDQF